MYNIHRYPSTSHYDYLQHPTNRFYPSKHLALSKMYHRMLGFAGSLTKTPAELMPNITKAAIR